MNIKVRIKNNRNRNKKLEYHQLKTRYNGGITMEEQENIDKIKNDFSNDNEILDIVEEFIEKVDPDNK